MENNPNLLAIDKELRVDVCKKCSKIKVKGKFVDDNEENLIAFIQSNLKVNDISNPKTLIDVIPLFDVIPKRDERIMQIEQLRTLLNYIEIRVKEIQP